MKSFDTVDDSSIITVQNPALSEHNRYCTLLYLPTPPALCQQSDAPAGPWEDAGGSARSGSGKGLAKRLQLLL